MRLFKRLDVYLQILLIIGALIQLIVDKEKIIGWYFYLGAWQLISFIVHLVLPDSYYAVRGRRSYKFALFFLLGAGLITSPVFLFYLLCLLFVTPVYAFFYLGVCIRENKLLDKKELIHLK